jgi:hypothetical protein
VFTDSPTEEPTTMCERETCTNPVRPGRRFCSPRCASQATAAQRGDALRDRGESRGYRKRGGQHEHRAVAEQKLGRPLEPGETVHHLNHDKLDNRPSNLVVLGSQGDHARGHMMGNQHARTRHEPGQACRDCDALAISRGYCNVHYQRRLKAGTL